jgi:hypothetical protein
LAVVHDELPGPGCASDPATGVSENIFISAGQSVLAPTKPALR